MRDLIHLGSNRRKASLFLLAFCALLLLSALAFSLAYAQEAGPTPEYRDFPFKMIGSRTAIWFVAQLHLIFAAFVLGVPIFSVILEGIGLASGDERYDKVSKDFIRLCLMAYSITALFGGMLSFFLIILYPKVWNYLVQIFSPTMYFYVVVLLAETSVLYLYYYCWEILRDPGTKREGGLYRKVGVLAGLALILICTALILGGVFFPRPVIEEVLRPLVGALGSSSLELGLFLGSLVVLPVLCFTASRKLFHVCLGVVLNLLGTTLMVTANIWSTFMKSPGHAVVNPAGEKVIRWAIDTNTGALLNLWDAILNETWRPINIHRFVANITVGGCIAAAYAAYRFLNAKTEEERAYYDWMGYTGNFIAIMALLPLPFAGYYLGREIYAWNEQMGINMMGGHFSWFFILQAVLIGVMFFGANYYLWLGLDRIPGGQRYARFIGWMESLLIVSFLVWITPHNPVATAAEIQEIGGPYHPFIKHFGVMAWKLTVVNLIILTTFLSFLFYRRANKKAVVELSSRQRLRLAAVVAAVLLLVPLIGYLDFTGGRLSAAAIGQPMEILNGASLKFLLLLGVVATLLIDFFLFLRARRREGGRLWEMAGTVHQQVLMAFTFALLLWLGFHGYNSSDAVRLSDSIWQVVWVLGCMVLVTVTDIFLLLPAGSMGEIRWGKMPARSQYVLFIIAVAFILTMSLMGTVRSGLRGPWHVFGYMKDTSAESFHPSLFHSSMVWAVIVFVFFLLVAFIFWLSTAGEKKVAAGEGEKGRAEEGMPVLPADYPAKREELPGSLPQTDMAN